MTGLKCSVERNAPGGGGGAVGGHGDVPLPLGAGGGGQGLSSTTFAYLEEAIVVEERLTEFLRPVL